MQKEQIISKKNELVERLGVYLENQDNMAPLEARIFSTLILTGKRGRTFEELIKDLNASKSTVCTHLNTLQASGRVSYHTRPGQRKRYFNVTPNRLVQVMDEMLQKWNQQRDIHTDILSYKKEAAKEMASSEEEFDLDFHQNYLQFLDEVSSAVTKLKQKISH
ncbi:MAG: helix-turn-helix domain-containing protein [Gillisia sp.]